MRFTAATALAILAATPALGQLDAKFKAKGELCLWAQNMTTDTMLRQEVLW